MQVKGLECTTFDAYQREIQRNKLGDELLPQLKDKLLSLLCDKL
jgi:hypothetical protein